MESVNGAILDAFANGRRERLLVADPFAGGGVIPLAATLRGFRVYAQDLNPWAAQGLYVMFNLPPPSNLQKAADGLACDLRCLLDSAYKSRMSDGSTAVIAHTFRVAVASCSHCGHRQRLFPFAMVSLLSRKKCGRNEAFLACPYGHLFLGNNDRTAPCPTCGTRTDPSVAYTPQRVVTCLRCGLAEKLETRAATGDWAWEVVLVERTHGRRRELGFPTPEEMTQAKGLHWKPVRTLGPIAAGRETAVLRRHGFTRWEDLYPRRQRVVIEHLLAACNTPNLEPHVAEALRLAALGTVEMAGYASRWDRWYLKSYESMAAHRFNFTTFTVEPNVWGTAAAGRGTFCRRVRLFEKASSWLEQRTGRLAVEKMALTATPLEALAPRTDVRVVCGSSERIALPDGTVDLILTDPPYHDDVQYGELSLPLRAWAQLDIGELDGEAVANEATGANVRTESYKSLLKCIFEECRRVLKPGSHLIFSYSNRDPKAWVALFSSLQDAGFSSCGYRVVHSENETDHAKRNGRACTMDLILDLVVAERAPSPSTPRVLPDSVEGRFIRRVGEWFLRIGSLPPDWDRDFVAQLERTAFLKGRQDFVGDELPI